MKALALAAVLATALAAEAANPYMPLWEFIPDGEPYVFEDPDNPGQYRVYVYGSHDSLIYAYCGREQVVWSAPVEDLNNWRYDGVIFESKTDAKGNPLNGGGLGDVLYAPDVAMVTEKDGSKTYYLYPNNQHWGRNGMVAKSKRPDGPFEVCNWDKKDPTATDGVLRFDPAVFVDDDGRVYGYWGFEESWGAEFDPKTMATVKPGTKPVKDMISSRKQDGEFRFFEASSMRKIKDKYVFVYSRWTADGDLGLGESNYTLAYAYSDNPLGPFTYGGTLIDGRGRKVLADGTTVPTATPHGNTHGSLCEINGKWYVFYHRQTGNNEYSRQAMVAPVEVTVQEGPGGKVSITEGEYNSEGFETDGLSLLKRYPAAIASYYTGPRAGVHSYPYMRYSGPYFMPTYKDFDPTNAPDDLELRSMPVVNCTDGSVLGYKYYNFDSADGAYELRLMLEMMPRGVNGNIDVWVGAPNEAEGGKKLGSIEVMSSDPLTITKKFMQVKDAHTIHGKQPLFFTFSSPTPDTSICDIYSLQFQK